MEWILYCEGERGSLDVQLLEKARDLLEQRGHPGAEKVEVRPAGGKGIVQEVLSAGKAAGHAVLGVRDRDYLPRDLVAQHRSKPDKAFPLSWHSIETYLLSPASLGALTGSAASELEPILAEEAEVLVWQAAVDGTIARYNRQHRRDACCLAPSELPATEEAALAVLEAQLRSLHVSVEELVDQFPAAPRLSEMAGDLRADGPLWTRVHGRHLQGRIVARLGGRLPKRPWLRLVQKILAEELEFPAQLITDLAAALAPMPISLALRS